MTGAGSAKHPKSETNTRVRPRESPTPARKCKRVIDLCPTRGYRIVSSRPAFRVPGVWPCGAGVGIIFLRVDTAGYDAMIQAMARRSACREAGGAAVCNFWGGDCV